MANEGYPYIYIRVYGSVAIVLEAESEANTQTQRRQVHSGKASEVISFPSGLLRSVDTQENDTPGREGNGRRQQTCSWLPALDYNCHSRQEYSNLTGLWQTSVGARTEIRSKGDPPFPFTLSQSIFGWTIGNKASTTCGR